MNLYKLRTERGLTQLEVASSVGVTEGYYSLIERHKRRPSVDIAKAIADVLCFSWQDFFEETPLPK